MRFFTTFTFTGIIVLAVLDANLQVVLGRFSRGLNDNLGKPIGQSKLQPIQEYAYTGTTTGKHLIKLRKSVNPTSISSFLNSGSGVTHVWENFHGFAGTFDNDTLTALRSSPDVESISEDGVLHTMELVTQTTAPWGLSRVSSRTILPRQVYYSLAYNYTYDNSGGSGVDIYIVDTGVYTAHLDFGGRARWGITFGGYPDADGYGHGTHCAGTAAGTQFGVAKSANIIAVKVLDDTGSGAASDIISGLDWVMTSVSTSGRPSIISMSLGGDVTPILDEAVATLTTSGIHVIIAAGNDATSTDTTSPARSPTALTVGASTISDVPTTFSNFGPLMDVWAPGMNVVSDWIGFNQATNIQSGTSMATPHVAGLVAYLIGLYGNKPPAEMISLVQSLSGRIGSPPPDTTDYLIQNGV
ncbi:serine proteinase [Pluteus cervinus]|uniref:Serine proteinase n=1 Tax=Pluteus cervinus TaxID=181527 RepID=A0ACD3ATZ1_9AGAR|nr:serine proteinase [Pluteus cervinus]